MENKGQETLAVNVETESDSLKKDKLNTGIEKSRR